MKDKVLEMLKENKNTLVREVTLLAIKTNRSFSEAAKIYNQDMVKSKYKEGGLSEM